MIALLDGDIYCYRVGFASQDVDLPVAIERIDQMLENTLNEVEASGYELYLTDSLGNFRLTMYPAYKANRPALKPKWLEDLKEHLIIEWGASISFGQEADDSLGIRQDKISGTTVICSIDKDMRQVPGKHYNFVEKKFFEVDAKEAEYFFYTQLIKGDPIDNIPGCPGLGVAKTKRALGKAWLGEESYIKATQKAYYEVFPKRVADDLILKYGRLLKIRQKEGEIWEIPIEDGQCESKRPDIVQAHQDLPAWPFPLS
jgi:5'-3' exonuclease